MSDLWLNGQVKLLAGGANRVDINIPINIHVSDASRMVHTAFDISTLIASLNPFSRMLISQLGSRLLQLTRFVSHGSEVAHEVTREVAGVCFR